MGVISGVLSALFGWMGRHAKLIVICLLIILAFFVVRTLIVGLMATFAIVWLGAWWFGGTE